MNVRDVIADYASRDPKVELDVHPDLPNTLLDAPIVHHEWARVKRPNDEQAKLTCLMVNSGDSRTWVAHNLDDHTVYPWAYLEEDAEVKWVFEND